jgi:hypothetical protein
MNKDYIEALEAVLRDAVKQPVTDAHWRTIEAVAKMVAMAKRQA